MIGRRDTCGSFVASAVTIELYIDKENARVTKTIVVKTVTRMNFLVLQFSILYCHFMNIPIIYTDNSLGKSGFIGI